MRLIFFAFIDFDLYERCFILGELRNCAICMYLWIGFCLWFVLDDEDIVKDLVLANHNKYYILWNCL